MSEYTSLPVSKRLAAAGFNETPDDRYNDAGTIPTDAYRADTLLSWLLNHGDSIEITPDLDGFNCTFWKGHEDYNGINIFLCDALAELVIKVLEDAYEAGQKAVVEDPQAFGLVGGRE